MRIGEGRATLTTVLVVCRVNRTNDAHKSALIKSRRDAFVWSLVYQEQGQAVCDWNKRGFYVRRVTW